MFTVLWTPLTVSLCLQEECASPIYGIGFGANADLCKGKLQELWPYFPMLLGVSD